MRYATLVPILLGILTLDGCHAGGGGLAKDAASDRPREDDAVHVDVQSTLRPPSTTVAITEIMYAPVLEEADVENHEFVEIYNLGSMPIALDGWRLRSAKKGISFTFPAGTTIAPGQYRVVAKNRHMLAAVASYGLTESDLLGDYGGELDNGGALVQLVDGNGEIVDEVTYDDRLPWPVAADALGVSEDWLAPYERPLSKHQYRGRSLERISVDFSPGSPANWEASALDGATPGKPNSSAGTVVPVVEDVGATPEGGAGAIIRNDQKVVVAARFSALPQGPSSVEVEYFVDDVTKTGIAPTTANMTLSEDDTYRAVLPATPDNSVVRYRIWAVRPGQKRVAAPRRTDPFSWFGYFVSPTVHVKPGVVSQARTYHMFIRPNDWTKLESWLALGRENGEESCTVNPDWDSLVPATFISEGKVYDVRVRYQGGRYLRTESAVVSDWAYPGPKLPPPRPGRLPDKLRARSWRVKFPKYDRFEGRRKGLVFNKMMQGCPGTVSYVESKLLEKAGIPSYQEDFGRLHINGGYFHYYALPEDIDDAFIERVYPGEAVGDLFKNDGAGAVFGPAAPGDYTPITMSTCNDKYKPADIYAYTYPRQLYTYRPHDELIKLITDLAAARNSGSRTLVREYFMSNWDWQSLLKIFVIRNWAGACDDTVHNNFPYKRPSTGTWILIQQDFEWDFGLRRWSYRPDFAPWNPNETLYIGWQSPDPWITKHCELAGVDNCNALGFSSLKDAFIGAFKDEFDATMQELTRSPDGVLSTESVSAVIDEAVSKFSVDDWLADPAIKICNVANRNADLYTWTKMRNAKVARSAAGSDARPPDLPRPENVIGDGGMAIDWTKCVGGDQPSVSAADFCSFYEKTCSFVGDASMNRFLDKNDCLAKYSASPDSACLAGNLCFASNFINGSDQYCQFATGIGHCHL